MTAVTRIRALLLDFTSQPNETEVSLNTRRYRYFNFAPVLLTGGKKKRKEKRTKNSAEQREINRGALLVTNFIFPNYYSYYFPSPSSVLRLFGTLHCSALDSERVSRTFLPLSCPSF